MREGSEALERLHPWLDDGNIVIAARGKYFRVHRSVLCIYSEVFRDMFALARHDDAVEDVIDGCPVVHLSDAFLDVEIMLKALYDRSYAFYAENPMPISVLSAFLRLGKKYVIRQLFQEAKRMLSFDMLTLTRVSKISAGDDDVLFPRVCGADPRNFMVMNIASECGLVSTAIVAAFYCCVACPMLSVTDGYDFNGSLCVLSAANKRCCFLVQCYIAEAERELFRCIAHPASDCKWKHSHKCGCVQAVLSNLRSIRCLRHPFAPWMDAWDNNLCDKCRADMKWNHEEARTRLWNELPVALGLGHWENIDVDV